MGTQRTLCSFIMGLGNFSMKINGAHCGIEAIVLGIVTNIGGFLFGYDTGQISGMLLFRDFNVRFGQLEPGDEDYPDLNAEIESILVSLMSIGSLLGALSAAYTADWWGRRWSMTFGVGLFIIGNISVGVPMFQSKCLPREIRGPVVASYQLLITVGILISNIINYGVREIEEQSTSWRIVIGLGIAFSLPLGIGILFAPESPRWLANRDRWDEARVSMARLRGMKHDLNNQLVEDDWREMYDNIKEQKSAGTGSWVECFLGSGEKPRVVYRTFLGMFVHFLQQWTGVNYFFYYGATIFESAGIDDPIRVQLILGAVNVGTTFPGLYMIEKFGRRIPLIVGACWQAAWLLIFASVATARPPMEYESSGIVMIVAACMFIASFAMTWGPFAWAVIGETFPLRTRAKQASVATASNWLGNFLIGFLTPYADDGISYAFGYVFFGCNAAAALLAYLFLFETKSLSLENVDKMYSEKSLKAWHSTKWLPEGYISRGERDPTYFERRRSSVMQGEGKKHEGSDSDDHLYTERA